jgi:hypothetical protein
MSLIFNQVLSPYVLDEDQGSLSLCLIMNQGSLSLSCIGLDHESRGCLLYVLDHESRAFSLCA